jgi:hypothetical protein
MRAASGNLPGSYRRPEKAWRPGAWPGYKNTPGAQWSNIDRGELRPPVIWASLAPGGTQGHLGRAHMSGALGPKALPGKPLVLTKPLARPAHRLSSA